MSEGKQFAWRVGLAAALLLCGTVAARADTFRSPKGYVVNIPHGWQIQHKTKTYADQSAAPTDMVYAHPPNALPIFRVEVDPQGVATMDRAPAAFRVFVETKYPSFRLVDQNYALLGGVQTLESRGWGSLEGKPMWIDMLFAITHGKNYTITLLAPAEAANASETTFRKIIATLHWTQPQP